MGNSRRSQRYRFKLPILFKGTYRDRPALTEDISFHGVFIRTDEARTPNQLVKFTAVDPTEDQHIDLLGIVARCVRPEEATPDRPPGIGVSLFGNSRETEARWVSVVRRIKDWVGRGYTEPPVGKVAAVAAPAAASPGDSIELGPADLSSASPPEGGARVLRTRAAPSPPPPPAPPPAISEPPPRVAPPPPPPETLGVDSVRRAHPRRPARFNVTLRPEGVAELATFEMRDISAGGTFVLTSSLLPLGSKVNLKLIHPTSGEAFSIRGRVVRAIDSLDPEEKGIGVRFDTDAVDSAAWDAFIRRNAPVRPVATEDIGRPEVRVIRSQPPPPVAPPPAPVLGPAEAPPPALPPPVLLDEEEQPIILLGTGGTPPPGAFDDD